MVRAIITSALGLLLGLSTARGDDLILKTPTREVNSIAISPDGKHLATSGYRQFHLFELPAGKFIKTVKVDGGGKAYELEFTQNGSSIIVCSGKVLAVYNLKTSTFDFKEDLGVDLYKLAFSPARDVAVVKAKKIEGINVKTSTRKFAVESNRKVEAMDFSPDGKALLVSPEFGRSIAVHSGIDGELKRELKSVSRAKAIRVLPAGDAFAMVSTPWKLTVVDMEDKVRFSISVEGAGKALDVSPDGKQIAVGTWMANKKEFVHIVDVPTQKIVKSFGPFKEPVFEVVFSQDGYLAACFKGPEVRIWKVDEK